MLYYFPPIASYVILIVDFISIFLFFIVLKTKQSKRVFGFVLIAIFIIPFNTLKIVPNIDFIKSTPGELEFINNTKTYSPVYCLDNNGDIVWIFLTIKNIPFSKVFDIEGRTFGMLAIYKEGKYGYVNFRYEKFKANVELNESNIQFDREGFLSDVIHMNKYSIISNYLSNMLTIFFILLILSLILLHFLNKYKLRNRTKSNS